VIAAGDEAFGEGQADAGAAACDQMVLPVMRMT
jgi:hypothetical protein